MFLVPSCSLNPIHWIQVLSREWRCSWSSADRRWSNYIWVSNNIVAYKGASYNRDFMVVSICQHQAITQTSHKSLSIRSLRNKLQWNYQKYQSATISLEPDQPLFMKNLFIEFSLTVMLPTWRPKFPLFTRSIPWLLMTWLLALPGHQQPWLWMCRMNAYLSSSLKDFNQLCHLLAEN